MSAVAMVVRMMGRALGAYGRDLGEVQPEAQQDDRVLQHLLRREGDAVLHGAARRAASTKGR